MAKISIADALEMPVAERILFVQYVWDSIAAQKDALTLTDAQRDELDRRLKAYHQNPDAGAPWDEVKTRVRMQMS